MNIWFITGASSHHIFCFQAQKWLHSFLWIGTIPLLCTILCQTVQQHATQLALVALTVKQWGTLSQSHYLYFLQHCPLKAMKEPSSTFESINGGIAETLWTEFINLQPLLRSLFDISPSVWTEACLGVKTVVIRGNNSPKSVVCVNG